MILLTLLSDMYALEKTACRTHFFSNKIIIIQKRDEGRYLLAVVVEEESQHQDVRQRDEEGGVRVELVLLHKDVGAVAQVEVRHDDAHPDHSLQADPESRGPRRHGRLPLLQTLHVGGHGPAVAPVTQQLQQQEQQCRAQEEAGQELLQQVGRRQRLAAGALDGPHQLVAHGIDDDGGTLVGGREGKAFKKKKIECEQFWIPHFDFSS